jgi:hypothetical protein
VDADQALDFFCIHGYAADGVSAAGGDPVQWDWWLDGWSSAPVDGLPASVAGYASYGKKSWMTETSGETPTWLAGDGFPSSGGFSIALKIHQALTVGRQSAWIYWQLTDGSEVANETLTDATLRESSPKYVAAKHFFRYVRPNAERVTVDVTGADGLQASAYVHDRDGTLTVVLVNTSDAGVDAIVEVPNEPSGIESFEARTSSDASFWEASTIDVADGAATVSTPGYGVVTLYGQGDPVSGGAGGSGGSGTGGSDAGGAGGSEASGGDDGGGDPAGGAGGSDGSETGGTSGAGGSGPAGGDGGDQSSPTPGSGASSDPAAGTAGSDSDDGADDESGCGCRVAGRPVDGVWGAWLLMLALCLRRSIARRSCRRP